MIKKYMGITLITASLAVAGCSSNDDDGVPGVDTPDVETPTDEVPTDETPDVTPPAASTTIVVSQEFTADPAAPSVADALSGGFTSDDGTVSTFDILLTAVGNAGLTDDIGGDGPLTIFAPTDAAFEAFGLGNLPSDPDALSAILQSHIVGGILDAGTIIGSVGLSAESLSGNLIPVTEGPLVGGANLVAIDIATANGIVHIVDAILVTTDPEVVVEEPAEEVPPVVGGEGEGPTVLGPSLDGLLAAGNTDYVDLYNGNAIDLGTSLDVNTWTVFIPTNDAIPDGIDPVSSLIVNDGLFTEGVLDAAGLLDAGTITTFSGATLTFTGTPDALVVNGASATPVTFGGTASLFVIDGLLVTP